VGPRVGVDDVEMRKFLTLPGLELQPLVRPTLKILNVLGELVKITSREAPLPSKYFSQCPVFKHPQSMFLP
jgi:hypothetical protein